jgi:broad specificity phosphatase PhoE
MLKKALLAVTLFFFCTSLFSQNNTHDSISTYYLIRHAEKNRSNPADKDPDLTKKGMLRALQWRQLFEQFQLDAVYSTNYKRTMHTALPTAKSKNLNIKTYHPFKIGIQQFLKDTKGKNVLIVGHSNTIPTFANKLIGKEIYPTIEDTNNANLYIVTIDGDKISFVLVKTK